MKTTVSKTLKTLMLVAVITLSAIAVQAQDGVNTSITASGTVLTPITVTGTALGFGDEIFPGIDVEIATLNGAMFEITGQAEKAIYAQFYGLENLKLGENELAVEYTAGSTQIQGENLVPFADVKAQQTLDLAETDGKLFIYLGGTVTPTLEQTAGTYTTEITLDLAYTGN